MGLFLIVLSLGLWLVCVGVLIGWLLARGRRQAVGMPDHIEVRQRPIPEQLRRWAQALRDPDRTEVTVQAAALALDVIAERLDRAQ